jgi:SAM-dependent methyltransferase
MTSPAPTPNKTFWNELCGTQFAKDRGIVGTGPEAVEAFDRAYLDFYPFLQGYLDRLDVQGQRLLDIGLGYGTMGQRLAEMGADYHGLDIAAGPVEMMRTRLERVHLAGQAIQGDALRLPFADHSFDRFMAIGSLHHTGNLEAAIQEAHRVLTPGGRALVMVYSRYSYFQWLKFPRETLASLLAEWRGLPATETTEKQRRALDWNEEGEGAPRTELTSRRQAHALFGKFSKVTVRRENCTSLRAAGRILVRRETLLPWLQPLGVDLYIQARK